MQAIFSKTISFLLSILLVAFLMPAASWATETSPTKKAGGMLDDYYYWALYDDGAFELYGGHDPYNGKDTYLQDPDQGSDGFNYAKYRDEVRTVRITERILSYCPDVFKGFSNVTSFENLGNLGMYQRSAGASATSFKSLFEGCASIEMLDASKLFTLSSVNMRAMFKDCSSLRELNLSGFHTEKVYDFREMFVGCASLEHLDISSFDTRAANSNLHKDADVFDDALEQITIGANFTLQQYLPDGVWYNSAGQRFESPAVIPQGVADTYTKAVPAESISISGLQSKYLPLGSEVQLTANVQPSLTSDAVTWISSNDSVVTVDGTGKVTAKGKGTAVVIVTAGNVKATVEIVVEDPVSSISLQETRKEVYLNDGAFTLQAVTSPAGLHPSLTWASSNEGVASVDAAGKVTPRKAGAVTITVATSGGKSASCALTVKAGSSKPSNPVVPSNPSKPNNPSKPSSSNPSSTTSKTQPMHRLYNPNSGEHFYTASAQERDVLVSAGWSYEDVGWIAPASSKTPVFRLYSGTDHHYTSSAAERDALVMSGWSDEGIGWYSDDAKGIPLYRQFNPNVDPAAPTNNSGSHNYTISQSENDFLCNNGWQGEGIGWYGCK